MKTINELNNEQVEALFEEEFLIGLTIDDVVFTHETLDHFKDAAGKHWKFETKTEGVTSGGLAWVAYTKTQTRKGEPREDLHVVDLGTRRATYRG